MIIQSKERLCIATVTDNSYFAASITMITSFLSNNKWFKGDIVIIADDEFTPPIFEISNVKLSYIKISLQLSNSIKKILNLNQNLKNNYRQLYSIEIFNLLNYSTVIFVDSDCIFVNDITIIKSFKPCLIACHDSTFYRSKNLFRNKITYEETNNQIHEGLYNTINAGFIIVKGSYLSKEHYNNMVAMIEDKSTWINIKECLPDEIILNNYFNNQFHIINSTLNFRTHIKHRIIYREKISKKDIKIIHFAGKEKPWNQDHVIKRLISDFMYIKYFNQWYYYYNQASKYLEKNSKVPNFYSHSKKIKIIKLIALVNPYTFLRYFVRNIVWSINPFYKF